MQRNARQYQEITGGWSIPGHGGTTVWLRYGTKGQQPNDTRVRGAGPARKPVGGEAWTAPHPLRPIVRPQLPRAFASPVHASVGELNEPVIRLT